LGLQAEAAVGLIIAGNADVAEGVFHGVVDSFYATKEIKNRLIADVNCGTNGPVNTGRGKPI
jgi:hypothetical protein